ncbi:MAG TPA: ABC transporter substrate-binding protein [Burkholderiales bacterium]|nr:ABC transporter substrate-binding protein [Burkholderiales bacterium]
MTFLPVIVLSLVMSLAAAPTAAQAPALSDAPAPIVVGAAVSQSGAAAGLAAGYRNALQLWQQEVNAAGGLLGRPIVLDLRDDGSDAVRAGALYGALIEGNADLLIGPYGSAASLMAAAQAERAGRVLINGAGPAGRVQAGGPGFVFQTTHPYASYGRGVLELAQAAGVVRLLILARDDTVSREMALSTHAAALKRGLEAPPVQFYGAGAGEFAPQLALARALRAQAWLLFGGAREAAEAVRAFRKAHYAPKLFFARDAADALFIELVGQDAEHTLAVRRYDPAWPTTGNARFAAAYAARFGNLPGASAAEGYAAATVLAEAVRRAGSLEPGALRAALTGLWMNTVLGEFRAGPDGTQAAAAPAVVQISKGRPRVVWPESLRSDGLDPYLPWDERRLLK